MYYLFYEWKSILPFLIFQLPLVMVLVSMIVECAGIMKNNLLGWLIIVLVSATVVGCRTTVPAQLTAVEEVRPAAPGSNYVWRNGDWRPQKKTYTYRQGYWTPNRNNRTYSSGYWRQNNRGYYWRNGRWNR